MKNLFLLHITQNKKHLEMYAIIGITITHYRKFYGGPLREDKSEEVVATFDARKKAEEYIKAARLKRHRHNQFYRANSLLSPYTHTKVIEYKEPPPLPHNPKIKGV